MNVAEGCGRNTEPDLGRFQQNAMGSASELEYGVEVSRDLSYLTNYVRQELRKTPSE
jgi:four helix bundle protein